MSAATATKLSLAEIRVAYARIEQHIHRTPVLTSKTFDTLSGGLQLFFKCENLQKTGAFKARGACNAVLKAKADLGDGLKGIVTHSSGNHGQAVAYACSVASVPCTVVVPKDTPQIKCSAITGYGAKLVKCEVSPTSRKETCQKIADENPGFQIVHPYDDVNVIAGQSTIALELHEQVAGLDAIVVPVSGGGMSSGIALATKAMNPACKIILTAPQGKMLGECLTAKERLWPNPPQFLDTMAEGIKTQQCGILTFPILCEHAEPEVITVNDKEMIEAMRLVAERMKLMIELSAGASAYAALFKVAKIWPDLKKVGVILCGGNADMNKIPWM